MRCGVGEGTDEGREKALLMYPDCTPQSPRASIVAFRVTVVFTCSRRSRTCLARRQARCKHAFKALMTHSFCLKAHHRSQFEGGETTGCRLPYSSLDEDALPRLRRALGPRFSVNASVFE